MSISESEKNALNNMCPVASKVKLGDEVEHVTSNGLYTVTGTITADATSGLAVSVPFDCTIVDVVVQCTTANASGTVTVSDGTNDITDAIVCAVDKTIVRAGTIDDAYSGLSEGDTLTFTTNGAADRGVVEVIVKKS